MRCLGSEIILYAQVFSTKWGSLLIVNKFDTLEFLNVKKKRIWGLVDYRCFRINWKYVFFDGPHSMH